jgi:hypothetical protein
MVSVTSETFTVELGAEALLDAELPEEPDEAELPDDEEEQAATASTAAVPATAKTARPCPARMELIMVKEFLLFSGKNAQETS